MTWEGAHFWERALRAAEDGALGAESRSPGGTQIITFLGGSGGECFPPGIHGNFTGWQESGDKEQEACVVSHPQIFTAHGTGSVQRGGIRPEQRHFPPTDRLPMTKGARQSHRGVYETTIILCTCVATQVACRSNSMAGLIEPSDSTRVQTSSFTVDPRKQA